MIEGEEEEKGLFAALKCHCGEFPFIVYWSVLLEEGSGLSPFPCSLLLGWQWSNGFRLGLFGETTGTILETLYYRNVNMPISVNSSNSQILVACPILSWSFRFKQTAVCWVLPQPHSTPTQAHLFPSFRICLSCVLVLSWDLPFLLGRPFQCSSFFRLSIFTVYWSSPGSSLLSLGPPRLSLSHFFCLQSCPPSPSALHVPPEWLKKSFSNHLQTNHPLFRARNKTVNQPLFLLSRSLFSSAEDKQSHVTYTDK